MSPLLDGMESEWRSQLQSMREAIAELKLDNQNGDTQSYGHDIIIDEGEATGESENDDIWDLWSDEEQFEESSDILDGVDGETPVLNDGQARYNREWLRSRCVSIAKGRSALEGGQLEEQISTLLASDMQGAFTLTTLRKVMADHHRERTSDISG